MSWYDRDLWDYEPAKPRKVEGGIKASSKQGAFARQWWGKLWITALEKTSAGARLQRGRVYARKGQVSELKIEKGQVKASVQGTSYRPYSVTMGFQVLNKEQWRMVTEQMMDQPLLTTSLLQGQLDAGIEPIFAKLGIQLFPAQFKEIQSACSCPDHANPCKHIAAVCYLLAEALDADPFIIFKLRGLDREAFFAELLAHQSEAGGEDETPTRAEAPVPEADPDGFWRGHPLAPQPRAVAPIPETDATQPKRLGPLPLWRSEQPFIASMESYYKRASQRAQTLAEKWLGDMDEQ